MTYTKPEAYSELWYIQNSSTFRTRDIIRIIGYLEPEAYSEPCQNIYDERFEKQLMAIIVFTS